MRTRTRAAFVFAALLPFSAYAVDEPALLAEYVEFLKIPNWARDRANIRRNAEHLVAMMERRGLKPRLLEAAEAPPLVYGEWLAPGAKSTYVFYSHYDGQPVEPAEWASPPFEPTLRDGRVEQNGKVVPLTTEALLPDWRLYGRAAADAKAPIMALLAAVDALRAQNAAPKANLKFVFDGEEEIGSPNLERLLKQHRKQLAGDLWLICDGPQHSSGAPTVVFGARGFQALEITVYGPNRAVHSGHYGNWAPNPAAMLAQLLASMREPDGRVRVEGFYDGVEPLGARERQALAALPDTDDEQRRQLGLARTEGGGKRLAELITVPSLNIRGLASGAVGVQANNAIPVSATASIDLRLVKGMKHETTAEKIIAHVRKQGFHVVTEEPGAALRLKHPRLARIVVDPAGYDAVRSPMDSPRAQALIAAVAGSRTAAVIPTMGGSVPLIVIEEVLGAPSILVPIVNHDNNQHAKNENLRLGHLWDGIETFTRLLALP